MQAMRRWIRLGAKPSGFAVVYAAALAVAAATACIPQLSDLRSDAGPSQSGHVSVIDTDLPHPLDSGVATFIAGGTSDGASSLGAATWAMTDSASTADAGLGLTSSVEVGVTSSGGGPTASSSRGSTLEVDASACLPGTRRLCLDCSSRASVDAGAVDAGACLPCESGGYCAGGSADFVACEPGTWDDDGSAETACSPMTECMPGQYVSAEGDALTDRGCKTCGANSFTAEANAAQCQPWSTCLAPNSYEAAAPDAAHDRRCEDCALQSVSLEDNARTCIGLVYAMSGGQAVFEAEHYHAVRNSDTDAWSALDLVEVSGDRCLEIGPDDKTDWTDDPFATAPRLDYLVQFDTVGTFHVHVRGDAGANSDGYSDSCYAAIDGATTDWYRFEILGGTWAWVSQTLDVATTGVHVVSIMAREDGFRVDKIVVSTNATLPTGDGPEESSRVPITQ